MNAWATRRVDDALALGDIDEEQARHQFRRAGVDPSEIEDRIWSLRPPSIPFEKFSACAAWRAADRIFTAALEEHFGDRALDERYLADKSHWPPKLLALDEAFIVAQRRWLGTSNATTQRE